MMNAAVAKRYGQALLQIGQEKNSIDRYQEDLKLVVDTMENSAELKDVLTSQTVSMDEKKNIVKQIFGEKRGEQGYVVCFCIAFGSVRGTDLHSG